MMRYFEIYLGDLLIDTYSCITNMDLKQIKKELVDNDRYDSKIVVVEVFHKTTGD